MSTLRTVQKIEDRLHTGPLTPEVEELYLWLTGPADVAPPSVEAVSTALGELEADDLEAAAVLSETEFARKGAPTGQLSNQLNSPALTEASLHQVIGQLSASDLTPEQIADLHAQGELQAAEETFRQALRNGPIDAIEAASADVVARMPPEEVQAIKDRDAQAVIEARHEAPYAGDTLEAKAADAISRMPPELQLSAANRIAQLAALAHVDSVPALVAAIDSGETNITAPESVVRAAVAAGEIKSAEDAQETV